MTKLETIIQQTNRWTRVALMGALVSVALTACGGQTVNMKEAVKASVSLDNQAMPADIKLASSAILMKLKGYGDDSVQGVSFAPAATQHIKAIGLDYDGFVLRGVTILNYEPTAEGTELVGLMVFEDSIGRRAGVRYLTEYQAQGQGIMIQHASVVQVHTVKPRIEAYVVPYDPNVDQAAMSADHNAMYSYAVNNAVPIQNAKPGIGDYDVFLFVMDRSSDTADTKGRVSKNESRGSGYEDATTLLDYNGWKVAVISGELDPLADNTLYAKLLHTPGEEAIWYSRSARLSGLFGLTVKAHNKALEKK